MPSEPCSVLLRGEQSRAGAFQPAGTTVSRAAQAQKASPEKVLVAIDDRRLRSAISTPLSLNGFDVVACSGDAVEKLCDERDVDLVLLDPGVPAQSGFDVCKRLKSTSRDRIRPIVLLNARGHVDHVVAWLDAGADGHIETPVDPRVLVACVRALLRFGDSQRRGGPSRPPSLQDLLNRRLDNLARSACLSRREREVLQLLVLGRGVSEVALVLGIKPRTAKFHQTNVLAKIGAESRFDLVRLLL